MLASADAYREPNGERFNISEVLRAFLSGPKVMPKKSKNKTKDIFQLYFDKGWGKCLIPIIPIGATLSKHSKIKPEMIGKIPGESRDENGEMVWCGMNWPIYRAELKTLRGCKAAVGVLSRDVAGIDIDLDIKEWVDEIKRLAADILGDSPVRFRENSSRALLPYNFENELGKVAVKFGEDGAGNQQAVEILLNGNQFVTYGLHKSGSPYLWDIGADTGEAVDVPDFNSLTKISSEQLEEFISAVRAYAESLGFEQDEKQTKGLVEHKDRDAGSYESISKEDDLILFELMESGCVNYYEGSGIYNILCPWIDEHSDKTGSDGGTKYMQRTNKQEDHFKCHHPGCKDKNISDLRNYLGLEKGKDGLINPIATNALELFSQFAVTKEDVGEIMESKYIVDGLLIQGHMITIAGEPNAGKTALLVHLCSDISKNYDVLYFNFDSPAEGIKYHYKKAAEDGYMLISPDIKIGLSVSDAIANLSKLADMDTDLSKTVLVLDTLKKCVDVINKSSVKDFNAVLRKLSARGCTVIMLAHTNKYRDQEDKLIYEGTGDVKSDTDELIYVEFKKHENGQTISTYPDKTRGVIRKMTFEMDKERNIKSSLIFKDVQASADVESRLIPKDKPHAIYIVKSILAGVTMQSRLVNHCRTKGFSVKGTYRILDVSTDRNNLNRFLERAAKDTQNGNAIHYGLIKDFDYEKWIDDEQTELLDIGAGKLDFGEKKSAPPHEGESSNTI